MIIKCVDCKYLWTYKGERESGHYISCPRCRKNIKILTATGELNPSDSKEGDVSNNLNKKEDKQ